MENTLKTIKGEDTFKNGYSIFHVWGNLKGVEISLYYATKNPKKLVSKYKANPKVYINPSGTSLERNYTII